MTDQTQSSASPVAEAIKSLTPDQALQALQTVIATAWTSALAQRPQASAATAVQQGVRDGIFAALSSNSFQHGDLRIHTAVTTVLEEILRLKVPSRDQNLAALKAGIENAMPNRGEILEAIQRGTREAMLELHRK